MNKTTYSMRVLALCCAVAAACGDDDSGAVIDDGGTDAGARNDAGHSTDTRRTEGTGGTGGNISSGGTGGNIISSGTGGKIGSSGTGGSTTPASVACGANTCAASMFATACCADALAGTCGVMMTGGGACVTPAKVDPSCPTVSFAGIGTMGSCCAANGMCGLDGSAFGQACVDFEMLRSGLSTLGNLITLPPAQRCGDSEGDAGTHNGDQDAGK